MEPLLVPSAPRRLLVLVPGSPWPDGSRTDQQIHDYARCALEQWEQFAARHATIVVTAVFDSRFPDFRVGGSASGYLTKLVEEVAVRHLPGANRRFAIYGHSAGAQFGVRYLLTHTDRLTRVVISAPSEYAFPDPHVAWPYGARGAPGAVDWMAASRMPVTVLVGTRDDEQRPAAPAHTGATRLQRTAQWVTAMRQVAIDNHLEPGIELRRIDGIDHDETALAMAAQRSLAADWQ